MKENSFGRTGQALLTLALVLSFAAFAAAQSADGVLTATGKGRDFSGFQPAVFINNQLFCSNPASGNDCNTWRNQCNQLVAVPYGGAYYEYVELTDIIHSGNYDFYYENFTSPPGRDPIQGPLLHYSGQSGNNIFCLYVPYSGAYSKPAGIWSIWTRIIDTLSPNQIADGTLQIESTCSDNSQCASNWLCRQGHCTNPNNLPDFTVIDIKTDPSPARAGENAILYATVKNNGPAPYSNALETQFKADDADPQNSYDNNPVNAGDSYTTQNSRTLPAGSHKISAVANADNSAPESNYANNLLEKTFTWVQDLPDLIAYGISVAPQNPYSNQPFTISFKIGEKNNKDVLTPFNVDLLVDGSVVQTYTVFAIRAGYEVVGRYTFYNSLPNGPHSLTVRVDSGNAVKESDENNDFPLSFTIGAPTAITQQVTGLAGEYFKYDAVGFDVFVRDSAGNAVPQAVVSVSDGLARRGAALLTDANGRAHYDTVAAYTGVDYVEVYASKYGFTTARQKTPVNVVDFNGRVYFSVFNPLYKDPVQGAKIEFGTQTSFTDSKGSATFLTDKGNVGLTVTCADGKMCTQQNLFINSSAFMPVACYCKADSDGDGIDDRLEALMGTDPNNANSNLNSWNVDGGISSQTSRLTACVNVGALLQMAGLSVQQQAAILKAASATTPAQTMALQAQGGSQAAWILSAAGLNASGADYPGNTSFRQAYSKKANLTLARASRGVFAASTDYRGNFNLFFIEPSCVGEFLGAYKGAGYGLQSDADFLTNLLNSIAYSMNGLDHLAAVPGEIAGFVGNVISGVEGLLGNLGGAYTQMLVGILSDGRKTQGQWGLDYSGGDYAHFQQGYFRGYLEGFVAEQVAVGAVTAEAGAIAKDAIMGNWLAQKVFQSLSAAGKLGQASAKLAEILFRSPYLKGIYLAASDSAKAGMEVLRQTFKTPQELEAVIQKASAFGAKSEDFLARVNAVATALGDRGAEIAGKLAKTDVGLGVLARGDLDLAKQIARVTDAIDSAVRATGETGPEVINSITRRIGTADFESFSSLMSRVSDSDLARLSKDKLYDILGEAGLVSDLKSVKTVTGFEKPLAKMVGEEAWRGPAFEIQGSARLQREGAALEKMGFTDTILTGQEMDIQFVQDSKKVVGEMKQGSPKNWDLRRLQDQLTNYRKYADASKIDEVRLISKETITTDIKNTINSWNLNIVIQDGFGR